MKNARLKMKKISKPDESADLSSFSCLPDHILLDILSRLIDLKPLCRCKLVSTRFNHTVQKVDTISVTITSVDHPCSDSNSSAPAPSSERERLLYLFKNERLVYLFKSESLVAVMKSLQTFSALKSLCIEIPPLLQAPYNRFLFKWKLEFANRAHSFLFLSPNSVCEMKENVQDEEEDVELTEMKIKLNIAIRCVMDAITIHSRMLPYMKCFRLLENVTITDAGKSGRVSVCGEINVEAQKSFSIMRSCYVPLLKLPVSGYMMKGVSVVQFKESDLPGDDTSMNMNLNDSEDKEEAAYSEAVMEIFKKKRDWIDRLL